MATLFLDTRRLDHYDLFLRVKALPVYSVQGHTVSFPDEYLARLELAASEGSLEADYQPSEFLFDYQQDIARLAILKRKFAVFAACGLGKTLIMLDYVRHASELLSLSGSGKRVLIVSPLMVVQQTMSEAERFYKGSLRLEQVRAKDLPTWLRSPGNSIGIANYEAITPELAHQWSRLGCLVLDESSMLKSHYGAWAQRLIEMGRGLDYKLCLTGTPAPNDRIEYANHAVFLDQFPTVNSFLSRYFVNRGQTDNRWELKPHALRPFYRSLSHWCIFLESPATYGWKDNVGVIPPINIHIHDVELTDAQRDRVRDVSKDLYGSPGGVTSRSKLAQLAKGRHNGVAVDTLKPTFIRDELIGTWPDESTIVWTRYNPEQEMLRRILPGCGSISGNTPEDERIRIIQAFQAGTIRTLVSKPSILGYGLNLQIATRQVFNGLWDSYESYWQAIKRSNRIGSKKPLNVHIPVTEIEKAMVDSVMRKAKMIEEDTRIQECLFKEMSVHSTLPLQREANNAGH